MSTVTIATFNCENLFRRYKFNKNLTKEQIEKRIADGFIIDKTVLSTVNQTERKLTADAIKATKADIVCLQEVENLDTLKNFVSEYLSSSGYKYRILIDANDNLSMRGRSGVIIMPNWPARAAIRWATCGHR